MIILNIFFFLPFFLRRRRPVCSTAVCATIILVVVHIMRRTEVVVVVVVVVTVGVTVDSVAVLVFEAINGGFVYIGEMVNPVGRDNSSRSIKVVFFGESVLVVMHPHFEDSSVDTNLVAKLHNHVLVALLHLPPHFVGELVHLLLLLLGEFRAEALPGVVRRSWGSGVFRRHGEAAAAGEGEEHVGGGGVGGDRRRRGGVRTPVRRGWRVVAVVGLVLQHMMRGRRNWRLFRLAAVEVAVAAAGGAFDGAGVVGGCGRRRHELAAAVEGVAA